MARILIVDDDDTVRFLLSKGLETHCHEIFEAPDGDVALEYLADRKIDLVITDILMPNREGLETIREIKDKWPDMKIIAISGGGQFNGTQFLNHAMAFGADQVFRKPVDLAEIVDAIDRIVLDWRSTI